MKHIQLTLLALLFSVASFALPAISGPSTVCVGSTIHLLEPSIVITPMPWSSSDITIATVVASSGFVTGVAAGVVTITYTQGTMYVTKTITVNPLPGPITGPTALCAGSAITLVASISGGTWYSSATGIATVGSSSGDVTGVSSGTAVISDTLPTGCGSSVTVTVGATPPITGPTSTCVGATTTLSDPSPGGTWSSSSPVVATIGSGTGVVTGLSTGTTTIIYTPSGGCPPASMTMTIIATPSAIGGPTTLCAGSTITLTDGGGGTWTGSPSTVATIGSSSGIVTGIAPGTFLVIYSLGAGCSVGAAVTVNGVPVCTVTGGGSFCAGGAGVDIDLSCSSPGISYQLFNGPSAFGPPVAGTGSSLVFGPVTTGGTYAIVAIDPATGCSANMTGTAGVTVNPLPPLCTVTGGGSYCAGGTAPHVGLSCSTAGIDYQTLLGGLPAGGPMVGTGAALDFGSFPGAGTYTITALDASTGCTATMTGSVTVTVNPLPAAITGTAIVCIGYTTTLSDATTGGNWSSSTITTASIGPATGVVTGVAGGTATITYTIPGTGCYTTTTVTVGTLPCSTGITELNSSAGNAQIYPNPASSELTVLMDKGAFNSYMITNEVGQALRQDKLHSAQSTINIQSLPSGLFIITLKGDNGNKVMRFVKL